MIRAAVKAAATLVDPVQKTRIENNVVTVSTLAK